MALPRGRIRDRYRQEFLAELYGLDPPQQLRLATGILAHSLALRSALGATHGPPLEVVMRTPTKPLLCRTNIQHRWEWAHTPDGNRFVRCRRCLKQKDDGPGWRSMTAGGA